MYLVYGHGRKYLYIYESDQSNRQIAKTKGLFSQEISIFAEVFSEESGAKIKIRLIFTVI
jgi:hypothetical protein